MINDNPPPDACAHAMRLVRLVLADDHPLMLDGLRALVAATPDLRVIATATDGERLIEAVHRFQPDMAVIDLEMPYMDGLTCLRQLRAEHSTVRVLIFSAQIGTQTLQTVIESGADGLALKTDPPQVTLAAIRQVAAGHTAFPRLARHGSGIPAPYAPPSLTDREKAVLALLANGHSNTQIAATLHLSENTVKYHLRNLFSKLEVTNRTEAAARFHRRS